MAGPLTVKHFDEVITTFKAHMDERFDEVDGRLNRLEKLLELEQRFDQY